MHARHLQVGEDEIWQRSPRLRERRLTIGCDRDVVSIRAEELLEGTSGARVVVDQQDPSAHQWRWISTKQATTSAARVATKGAETRSERRTFVQLSQPRARFARVPSTTEDHPVEQSHGGTRRKTSSFRAEIAG